MKEMPEPVSRHGEGASRRPVQRRARRQRPSSRLEKPGARGTLPPGGPGRRHRGARDRRRSGGTRRQGGVGGTAPARGRLPQCRLRPIEMPDPLLPRRLRYQRGRPLRGERPGRVRGGLPGRHGAHAAPPGAHQRSRLGPALHLAGSGRLPGGGAVRRPGRRGGGREDAPLLEGGDRHGSARRRASRRGAPRSRLPDERVRLLPDRAAEAASGVRSGTDRLRDGASLPAVRLRGDPHRAGPPVPDPGGPGRGRDRVRCVSAGRDRRAAEHRGVGGRRRRKGEAGASPQSRRLRGHGRRGRDPDRRRARAQRRGDESGGSGGRVRSAERSRGRRFPADHQPPHLRGGRHLPGAQVHPHRGRRGAHRDPERPLPGKEAL